MHPRLTRAEYWLLETAVESGTPLSWLCAENYRAGPDEHDIEYQFNKTSHGLVRAELVQTLSEMFRLGWIEARRNEQVIPMDVAAIETSLAESGKRDVDERTYYWLTKSGGAIWEAFSAPNWERYLQEDISTEIRPPSYLTGMTEWRVRHYLENLHLMGYDVDPGTIRWETIGEWEATYWKKLPHGRRVEFSWVRELDHSRIDHLAFSGLCEFRDGWYHWR